MSVRPLTDRSKNLVREGALSRPGMGTACGNFGTNNLQITARLIAVGRAIRKRNDAIVRQRFQENLDVSLHKGLLRSFGSALQTRIVSRISGVPQIIKQQPPVKAGFFPAAGVIAAVGGRVLPAIGRAIGSRTATAAGLGAGAAGLFLSMDENGRCPVGFHANKQDGVGGAAGTYCVRNRRMNFGNAKSARRSVRRLKGARKLLKDIEKMMPTRTVTRRRHSQAHN